MWTRQLFAGHGLLTVVVDAPWDRQSSPHLGGFRQRPEHAADIKTVIDWAREQAKVPVWLVGTSRGTQSAAYVATELTGPEGPDGLVLTSTILTETTGRPVLAMPLGKLRIPVLAVHHEYNLLAGRLWVCILLWIAVAPYIFFRMRRRRPR